MLRRGVGEGMEDWRCNKAASAWPLGFWTQDRPAGQEWDGCPELQKLSSCQGTPTLLSRRAQLDR